MAKCCWTPDWQFLSSRSLRFWGQDSNGWVDLWQEGDSDQVYSGSPQWADQAGEGVEAWNEINTAVGQFMGFINRPGRYSHFGESQIPRCFRTDEWRRQGGAIPVAFFIVPDYYLDHVTPNHENRFAPSTALNFNRGAGSDIARQLRSSGYIQNWEQWKKVTPGNSVPVPERPPSFSTETISIVLKWIWFDRITFPGGSWHTTTHWLSNHGGLCRTDMRVDWPRKKPGFSGFSIPIIFLKKGYYQVEEHATNVYVGPLEFFDEGPDGFITETGPFQILDDEGNDTGETFGAGSTNRIRRVPVPQIPSGAFNSTKHLFDGSFTRSERRDKYTDLAKLAQPVNVGTYTSITDMVNQLNPYDEDDLEPLRMYVNGQEVNVADGRVYDNLSWLPVQQWSAPNQFANGGNVI